MSVIDNLINEINDAHVEFKKLIDISEIGTGSCNRQDATDNGLYPFYVRSKDVFRIDKYEYDEEAIIIPGEGGIGEIFHYVNGKYSLHQRAYRIHILDNRIKTKFLYYYMFNNFKSFIMSKAVNATVTSIRKPMIEQFVVPIPPVELQNRIITILDKYNNIQRIVDEEINKTKKQFNYCKIKLLSNYDYKCKISEIALSHREKNKNQLINNAYSITQKGLIPTSEYFGEKTKITSTNTSGYYIVEKGWFVYSPSRIDVGSIGYLKDNITAIVSPIDVVFSLDNSKIDNDYLLYFLLSPKGMSEILYQRQGIEGTGRKNLPFENFSKIEIPLPKLDEQKRVVGILKKFEKYINEILITKRNLYQKQYEYYRNKLLNFEEIANE